MTNWIQLSSGNGYDFEDESIFGEFTMEADVAQPLAGCNRFVRHTDRPWSVAAHSVAVARTILAVTQDKAAAAAGLMHDCHEAVIGDIPTPVAWHIGYDAVKALKQAVHLAIFERLHIPIALMTDGPYAPEIEAADRAALHVERQLFMSPEPRAWSVPHPHAMWMREMYKQVRTLATDSHYIVLDTEDAQLFAVDYERLVRPLSTTKAA